MDPGGNFLNLEGNLLDEQAIPPHSLVPEQPEVSGNLKIDADAFNLHNPYIPEGSDEVAMPRDKSHEANNETLAKFFPFLFISPPIKTASPKGLELRHHLSYIQKLTEIPEGEISFAFDVIQDLQNVFNNKIKKTDPPVRYKVDISRHWLLNLMYSPGGHKSGNGSCPILIYKCDLNGDHPKYIGMGELTELEKLFLSRNKKKLLFLSHEVSWSNHEKGPSGYGTLLYTLAPIKPARQFSFKIEIESSPMRLIELQVWRLLEYLCTFDPHCRPLLTVAYYWARCNSITFGFGRRKGCPPCYLPDPNGLNWLLMMFLHQEGLIPSPKMILEQPHKVLRVMSTDVGFEESTDLEVSWREMKENGGKDMDKGALVDDEDDDELFAENVFKLLCKFFLFCVTKLGGISNAMDNIKCGWIVNTRDGEILPLKELLATGTIANCNLTRNELANIKVEFDENEKCDNVIMLHPFKPKWRIAANNAGLVISAMKRTGSRLKDYFDGVENGQSEKLTLNQFLNLLKIGKYE